ncbi:MAG: hypothetical protein HZB56_03230 [Deltaproteobacteria bacterium]|nr:hypothetical protein [Deltaproteobacteria bacterium]
MRAPLLLALLAAAAPALAAAQGKGTRVDRPGWGVSFALPGGWKSAEKEGVIVAGSDTEAGLIVVRFLPTTSRAELVSGFAEGIQEQGFAARPVGSATDFAAPGGTGLAGVLEGMAQDGSVIRVRSVAVLSGHGGAVVVLGLTTRAQYAALAARVDALGRSVTFRAPPRGTAIAGDYQFIYVSKVGSYSREARLVLCRSGRFQSSGEMAGSGSAGSAVVSRGNGGTWTAAGDATSGSLTLTWSGGGTTTLRYQASQDPRDRSGWGPALRIGDTLYQKAGPGDC